jgi:NAD-dependent dihydropyrimidine dehydrogenase PreA subunit
VPTVTIDPDACENSQACEAVCPADVFAIARGVVQVVAANECTLCYKCLESCASGAIELD